MNKIKGILISTLLLLSILTIITPVSAGTVHVYPGDDIFTKLNGTASGDTVYVHAGTYTLSAEPDVSNKSLTIIGDGASSTIINFVGSGTRLYFYMYPGPAGGTINISGITFKGDSTSKPVRLLYFYNNTSGNYNMTANITDCVFDKASELVRIGSNAASSQTVVLENNEFKNGSGVGILVENYGKATVKNCLLSISGEVGIESRDVAQTNIQSCTIDRSLDGIRYSGNAYGSVKDSIITNNVIGIRNQGTGTVTATYNNVWNNSNTNYQGVTAGEGSISQNPSYATGRLGSYYLSPSSPCVDKGSASAASIGLDKRTTRTDEQWDTGTLDMGYHYPSNRGPQTSLPIDFILKLLKKNKNK